MLKALTAHASLRGALVASSTRGVPRIDTWTSVTFARLTTWSNVMNQIRDNGACSQECVGQARTFSI